MLKTFAMQWKELPVQWGFFVAYLMHIAIYVFFAAGTTLIFATSLRVFKNGAPLDTRPLRPNQIRFEVSYSLVTCAICAVYTVVGLSISHGVWPASWLMAILQAVAFLTFYDFYFYWTHRLLHTPYFSRFHGIHHRSVRVTSWAVHSLHPVEASINHLPVVLFMLVWPTSISSMVFFHALLMSRPSVGHSNFDPYPNFSWLRGVKDWHKFHQQHHMLGQPGNFGFLNRFWDRVFGTGYQDGHP
jgi:Delta7-sterol 5-desaturase